jgi:hypothetical protein
MRRRFFLFAAFVTAGLAAVSQEQAVPSAESWLTLVDSAKYVESWSAASSMFRTQVPAQKWAEMVGAVRGPLGAKKSRKLKGMQFSRSLPGAPDGNYAVIQFDASFANKAAAVETITMMEDAGEWRSAGYFIR